MENTILHFGSQTKIKVYLIRDWDYEKFETKFTEAFREQYNTEPDFDLRKAWKEIQVELKKINKAKEKEIKQTKKGKHKK